MMREFHAGSKQSGAMRVFLNGVEISKYAVMIYADERPITPQYGYAEMFFLDHNDNIVFTPTEEGLIDLPTYTLHGIIYWNYRYPDANEPVKPYILVDPTIPVDGS